MCISLCSKRWVTFGSMSTTLRAWCVYFWTFLPDFFAEPPSALSGLWCSVGLTGLQMGHSRTAWSQSHSFVILAVWFSLCFIRPDTSVSRGLSPSGDTWPLPSGLSCTFNQGAASVWPLQGWLKVILSPQSHTGALSEGSSGSWSPPWLSPFWMNRSDWKSPAGSFVGGSGCRYSPLWSQTVPYTPWTGLCSDVYCYLWDLI